MSLVILEDLIKKKITLTDKEATKISKVLGERELVLSNISNKKDHNFKHREASWKDNG